MTSQPCSPASPQSSPQERESWRRSELRALADNVADGRRLLERITRVEEGRSAARLSQGAHELATELELLLHDLARRVDQTAQDGSDRRVTPLRGDGAT